MSADTDQRRHFREIMSGMFADRPRQRPAEWAEQNVRFDEPNNSAPFSLAGREYMRDALDDWSDPEVTDSVDVFGSQTGKTAGIMAGAVWTLQNNPSRILWVMPTRDNVTAFSKDRWIPCLRASECTARQIPTGRDRHKFSTRSQRVGSSIVSFAWSNSPSGLASTPAPIVILDEVDKFSEGTKREANAVNLAEQRTKNFANPKRKKVSTPTLVSGLIWQEFLKTDQRRRFLPCPHCGKFVCKVWSKQLSVFPPTGREAIVRWDPGAKRADKSWDLDRVERSAHYVCPHCAGHILDGHNTKMDREGRWEPTAQAVKGYRGRHLSSLYASSPETRVGRLAVKFLQAKRSLLGLQGFINGDLAEPYVAQDTLGERIELVTRTYEQSSRDNLVLAIDCQVDEFFYVVRSFSPESTIGIKADRAQTWEELRDIQKQHKIPDVGVIVDSGYGARSDAEVYANCARFGTWSDAGNGQPFSVGWLASKGMPSRKRWRHESGEMLPWTLGRTDPYAGTSEAGRCLMMLLEFSGEFYKDVLSILRTGKKVPQWSVLETVGRDEYWHHLDAEIKTRKMKLGGFVEHVWAPRSKHWPNHWLDCEVLALVLAGFHGMIDLRQLEPPKEND